MGELVRNEVLTPARVKLGVAGASLPTGPLLELRQAEAEARDAVSEPLATLSLLDEIAGLGLESCRIKSAVRNRAEYLRHPDLGRHLMPGQITAQELQGLPRELVIVVADGLSALAANRHAVPLLRKLLPLLADWLMGPVCVAELGRVAIGDEIGERLGTAMVLVLIGERPGLSAADSMGAYITWQPRVGRTDAERNCISNIRPEGLDYQAAALQIAGCLNAGRRLRFTGVAPGRTLTNAAT